MAAIESQEEEEEEEEQGSSDGGSSSSGLLHARRYLTGKWLCRCVAATLVLAALAVVSVGYAALPLQGGAAAAAEAPPPPPSSALGAGARPRATASRTADAGMAQAPAFAGVEEAELALDKDGNGVLSPEETGSHSPLTLEEFKMQYHEEQAKVLMEGGAQARAAANHYEALMAKVRLGGSLANSTDSEPAPASPAAREPGEGFVHELYTFGAPGTAKTPLKDPNRQTGCISGLRIFNKGIRLTTLQVPFAVTDPVAALSAAFGYKHPSMQFLQALQHDNTLNPISDCSGAEEVNSPSFDNFWWLNGHVIRGYTSTLEAHEAYLAAQEMNGFRRRLRAAEEPQVDATSTLARVSKARAMSTFSNMCYMKAQQIGDDLHEGNWSLIGRSCSQCDGEFGGLLGLSLPKKATGGLVDTLDTQIPCCDNQLLLFQENNTLECALAFKGSDNFLDWLANLDTAPADFCGLGKVHRGFRNKALRMIGGIDYMQVMRPQLKYCAEVTVTGHSLGAAMAELFTSCAARRLKFHEDGSYHNRLMAFGRSKEPKRLTPYYSDHAEGFFFRNRGNGLCIDVKGTMATDYMTDIVFWQCETPDSIWAADQQWALHSNGSLVNQRSGKCMDSSPSRLDNGETIVQWACEKSLNQTWEFTEEGFLQSTGTGKCVDSDLRLYTCPFTDQRWALNNDGQMVNKLSGQCLDVESNTLVIKPCGADPAEVEKQRWEFTSEGLLERTLTGECAILEAANAGRHVQVALTLGACMSFGETDIAVSSHIGKAVQFEWIEGEFLLNRRYGRCLNVAGTPGLKSGTKVNLGTCEVSKVKTTGTWRQLPGGFVKNVAVTSDNFEQNFRCITVFGTSDSDKVRDGAKLFVDVCKVNTDQKWEVTESGFFKNVIGGRKCMDVKNSKGEVWLQNCKEAHDPSLYLDMKFKVDANQSIIKNWLYQSCVDVFGKNMSDVGTSVDLWRCENGSDTDQRWIIRPDGTILNRLNKRCLGASSKGGPQPEGRLMLDECPANGTSGTVLHWEHQPAGLLRNLGAGRCAAIRWNGQRFKPLELRDCPEETTQRWEVLANGQIMNLKLEKCLSGSSGAASRPVLAPCDTSSSSQFWDKVPAAKTGMLPEEEEGRTE